MKLDASLFSFAAIATSLATFTSIANAQPPLPPPASQAPLAQSAQTPAPPSTSASPEADRGARGESCRARPDCQTGLACIANVCRIPNEGKACGARSDCGAPLACIDRTCVVEGERPLTSPDSAAPPVDAQIERPSTISLDESFFTRSADGANGTTGFAYHSSSTILGFDHRLTHIEIEGAVPFAFAITSSQGENETSTTLGNPEVRVSYVRDFRNARLHVGGILALPLASSDDDARAAQAGALGSRGLDRAWLWAPKTGTLAPMAKVGSKAEATFQHEAEAILAPLITEKKTTFILQLSEDLGARFSIFRAGARAELVFDSAAQRDAAQLSVLPYFGVEGAPGFVDLGLLVNLTTPEGFSFDEGKFWGLRLRAGARF